MLAINNGGGGWKVADNSNRFCTMLPFQSLWHEHNNLNRGPRSTLTRQCVSSRNTHVCTTHRILSANTFGIEAFSSRFVYLSATKMAR